ncbi:MAG: hypothetical protein JWP67_1580, partial [Mucilaginibacter sp.]|nr:hypothetical protein [Mucilaginibacter sp.]
DSLQNDQPIMDYQQIIFESKLIATLQ